METVLANPHPHLPEVVRLGWLIATLGLAVPRFAGTIPRERLSRLTHLALVPAALAAGEYVELCAADPPALRKALAAWHLIDAEEPEQVSALAERLSSWWQAYCEKPTAWQGALAALDRTPRGPRAQRSGRRVTERYRAATIGNP